MTTSYNKIIDEIKKIKNFDLYQYNSLLLKYSKEEIFDTFISLYYNSNREEQKNMLNFYYPIFISFELENIDFNKDTCFLLIDKYGMENINKYFIELLNCSNNKNETRRKYAFFYNMIEEEKEMEVEVVDNSTYNYDEKTYTDNDSYKRYLSEIIKYPLLSYEDEKKYFGLLYNIRNDLEIVKFDKDFVLSLSDIGKVINSIYDYQTRKKVEKISKFLCLENKNIISKYVNILKMINGRNKIDIIIPDKSSIENKLGITLPIDKYDADYFNKQLDLVLLYCQTREYVYNCNLRLVVSIAKRFRQFNFSIEDRTTEGNIGLMKAVERFDPNKGYKFSTYATWWIRQSIARAIADQSNLIRIPVHMNELINKVSFTKKKISLTTGREPTDEEIASELNISVEKVKDALKASIEPTSLETPIGEEEDSHLGDFIADESSLTPEQSVFNNELKRCINEALKGVSKREREVIELRFALNGGCPMTLEEVGNILGVTRERVRQIEAKTLRKLRTPSKAKILKDFIN